MRIASPKRQAVQSLGRHSVGNTGLEGDASLVNAVTDVASGLAIQASQLIDKREQEKASLFMQKEDSTFWKQYGNKEFFDANDLPQEFVTEGMQISGRVASAEVLPKMYEAHIKTSMGQASKMIGIKGSRNDWLANSKATADGRLNKVQMSANTVIDKQIFTDQKINYANALEARRPEVAYTIAQSMNTSDENREVFLKEAKQSSEIITYEDMITEGNTPAMVAASAHLGQPVEDYEGSNGELDSTQRLQWKKALDGELNRLAAEKTSTDKFYKAQLKHRIDTQIELSKSGKATDPSVYTPLLREVELANAASEGDYEADRLDLVDAVVYGNAVNVMNKANTQNRWRYINGVMNSDVLPPLARDKLVKNLVAANESLTRDLNTDFMGAANGAGAFGPRGMFPVDIQGDPQTLANQISARDKQYSIAQENYGTNLGNGMFTTEEAKLMGQQLNSMSTVDQLKVIDSTITALGPGVDSGSGTVEFFQQLGKDGDAATFAIAGIAQSYGYRSRAHTMLEGRKWRMENGKDLSTLNTVLDNKILTELKNAYINQPEKYRAVVEATKDAYYGRRQSAMDLVDQSIDGDDFDAALLEATGGLWEHGGKMLPVPTYGMNLDTMPRWIQDTSSEHFIGNTPAASTPTGVMDAEVFWNDVQEGVLQLEPYEQPGTYTVMRDGRPLPSNQLDEYGRQIPYLLRYDSSAPKSVGWWNKTKDAVGSMLE